MTKKKIKKQKKLIQWHPAFYATIQIELKDEADKLIFESEHNLSTKPLQIDVLIIKKLSEQTIIKNIGQIFKTYNIIEYKSPDDYLSIDDFYKVYGYTCLYKALTNVADTIKVNDVSISFICHSYPQSLINHLKSIRKYSFSKKFNGIYYIHSDIFPIQLIITSQLSDNDNLWLHNLTKNIKSYDTVDKLVSEYNKHQSSELYKSAMNVIVRANNKSFEEAKNMCEALRELFGDEIDKAVEDRTRHLKEEVTKQVTKQVTRDCIRAMIHSCKSIGGSKEAVHDLLLREYKISNDEANDYLSLFW